MFGKAYSAIGSIFNKVVNPIAGAASKGAKIYSDIPEEYREQIEAKADDLSKGTRTDYPPRSEIFWLLITE